MLSATLPKPDLDVSDMVMRSATKWNSTRRKKGKAWSKLEPTVLTTGVKKTLSDTLRHSDGGWLAIELLTAIEEDEAFFTIRAADCYKQYVKLCNEYKLKKIARLSKRAFSMLAQEFVHAFKGRDGYHWYTVNNIGATSSMAA